MNTLLQPGQTLTSASGIVYTVQEFSGGDGQGEVYRVTGNGKEWALKWYFPNAATEKRYITLENLTRKGPPNNKFLWPLEIITDPSISGFGYVMILQDKKFKGLMDLMRRKIDPSFYALVTAGFHLADGYYQLHSKGWYYEEISFINIVLEPKDGDILICNNEYVIGIVSPTYNILGTPRFMAPEIIRDEAGPSTETDLYSLAVLLFYMFFMSHPLEGKKETAIKILDQAAEKKLYGTEPVFIFDPVDESNRPDPQNHKNALIYWELYPQFFKNLFIRAFTDGINNTGKGRVRENEWKDTFLRLRDSIVCCQNCKSENFFDFNAKFELDSEPHLCWNCKSRITYPLMIKIDNRIIPLNMTTQLFKYHLDGTFPDLTTPFAKVKQHPAHPDVWGLQNLSDAVWNAIRPDGSETRVPPTRSITLTPGLEIRFGEKTGSIDSVSKFVANFRHMPESVDENREKSETERIKIYSKSDYRTGPVQTNIPMVLICDCSGPSQKDAATDEINRIMPDVIRFLKRIHLDHLTLKIRILIYGADAQWLNSRFDNIDSIQWKIIQTKGSSDFSAVLNYLIKELSDDYSDAVTGEYFLSPLIILVFREDPAGDYHEAFHWIKESSRLRRSIWCGIPINAELSHDRVIEFFGENQIGFTIIGKGQLEKIIDLLCTRYNLTTITSEIEPVFIPRPPSD